jgi:hypothetical protein
MSASLLDTLREEIELLIGPVIDAAGDPGACRRLLSALGADDSFAGDATLLAALQAAVDLETKLQAVFSAPEPSFAGVSGVLAAMSDLFYALRGLDGTSEAQLQRIGTDLVALLCGEYLRMSKPMLYRVGTLLTLVTPIEEAGMSAVANGNAVVRRPFPCAVIQFDQVSPLVNSPEKTLGAFYFPNGLATVADANAAADALFPRIGDVLTMLGVPWSYGVPDEDMAVLGDAAAFVDHAFQISIPSSITGSDVDAGITFTLSSDDRGGLGLVVSPFGNLEFSTSVDAWTFDAKLGAEIEALAIGPQGPTFIASADTVAIDGSFAAALTPPASGAPAYVFGSTTGTRLELGTVKFGVEVDASLTDVTVTASAGVSSGALVIAAGDGDSFLQSVLPAGGLRATFDLGIAYSTKGGLAFSGGAGLEATLPVTLSLGGVVALQGIHLALSVDGSGAGFETSAIASLNIGPLQAVVDRMGITTTLASPPNGGNLGVLDLQLGFKPPSGVGLAIDAAGLSGGGYIGRDDAKHEYSGVLELAFETYTVSAFALLATVLPSGPGYSLIALVDASFPPIQLGLGFTLDGVGGLFGLHRTADVDALRAALTAHTLANFLFPKSPITNAPQVFSELDTIFPGADGRFLFGPMVRIEWGTPALVTIDLALILELPDPIRLVLIAEIAVVLPTPSEKLLEIHISALGTIDFGTSQAALDATIYDSHLMKYTLHGSMALRVNWSGDKTFLLAVGGVHPKFQPPPDFPKLDRVGISMASGHIAKLDLDGYVAITSNTLQIGAHVDIAVGIDGFGISGYLTFDTLIGRNPFRFDGDISGAVALTADGRNVMSLQLSASLSGPAPWNAAGSVSFSILWWTVTKSFAEPFGDTAPALALAGVDVGQLLRTALADPRSITAQPPSDAAHVATLVAPPAAATVALAHPLATLAVHQTVVPLGITIAKYGGAAPAGNTRFDIASPAVDGATQLVTPLLDDFSPGQFFNLSDDEELSSPSFEKLQAGIEFSAATAFGAQITRPLTYETFYIDTVGGEPREDTGAPAPLPWSTWTWAGAFGAAARSQFAQTGNRRFAGAHQLVAPAEMLYVVATSDTLAASGVGVAGGQTYAQAFSARAAEVAAHPDRTGALVIAATYEVAQ